MKRLLIGASILFNVVVVGILVWFFWAGGQRQIVRSFLAGSHERAVSLFDVVPVASADVVFIGDSITAGGEWSELFPGASAKNRGIGGDATQGILDRLDQVIDGQPAKLFVKIGTNDLGLDVPEDEIVANLEILLERVTRGSPETKVYVQSVLPRAASFQPRIESLNRRFAELATAHEATWIDLYPLFLQEDGSLRDELSNDELHLVGQGYGIWRDAIETHVRKGLRGSTPGGEVEAPFDEPEEEQGAPPDAATAATEENT